MNSPENSPHYVKIVLSSEARAADPLKQYFNTPVGIVLFPSNTSPDLFVQSPSDYGTYFMPSELETIERAEYNRLQAEYDAEIDAEIAAENEATDVIFRLFDGEIIALFPALSADLQGNCLSYMHVGQHGAASFDLVMKNSLPAPHDRYNALGRELVAIGYILNIITE